MQYCRNVAAILPETVAAILPQYSGNILPEGLYFDKGNHLCIFGRVHHEGQFCEIILNLDQWIRRCRIKDISYLELWWHLCSAEWDHLCNFGRMHHVE